MTEEMKEKIKAKSTVDANQLREYFTKVPKELSNNGCIEYNPIVPNEFIKEITNTTLILEEYLKLYFSNTNVDYHYHSNKFCYLLSSLFCFANESWNLVQGTFDFTNKERIFYHSWLEKNGIIYDPAMRVVTLSRLYKEFFIFKYYYTQNQAKELFRRTSFFTYYQEDLDKGIINRIGKIFIYDTPQALKNANITLNNLDEFINSKVKIKK